MGTGTRALLVVAAIAATARADKPKPKDWDDQQAEEDSYWSQVAYPNRARYRELVQEGRVLSANPQTAGNLARAEELFREAIALEPDEPYARYLLADRAYAAQRYEECAEQYLAVEKIDPAWTPPYESTAGPALVPYRAGHCLSLSGRIEESIPEYQKVIAADFAGCPVYKHWVYWALGDCYQALGRLEDAIVAYQRATVVEPNNEPMLWFAIGVAYDRDNQIDESREAMVQALQYPGAVQKLAEQWVVYLPTTDEDYYHGLAYQVAYAEKGNVGDRVRAIAHFRRYVATVADQTWVGRAREHLTELGSTAIGTHEIEVEPADAHEKDAIVKAVLAGAPDLQKCLAADPYTVVRATVTLAPPRPPEKGDKGEKGKKAVAVPPKIAINDRTSLALPGADQPVQGCIISKIKQLGLPATPKSLIGVTIDLSAL